MFYLDQVPESTTMIAARSYPGISKPASVASLKSSTPSGSLSLVYPEISTPEFSSTGDRPQNTFGENSEQLLLAQAITPAADGVGTQINTTGNTFNIQGGTFSVDGKNQFHSFQQFGLDASQIANFITNSNVQNILGRVTGGNPSVINGLIQVTNGTANLYLMNPAGVIFGTSSSLNIPGSFTATTANAIKVDEQWFGLNTSPSILQALTGSPNGFAFTTEQPGVLLNEGNLAVQAGQQITLVGGTVVTTGTLHSEGGKISIAAVPGGKYVSISAEGSPLSLELPIETKTTLNNENPSVLTPLSLPQLLTGGTLPYPSRLISDGSTVRVAKTNEDVSITPGSTFVSNEIISNEISISGSGNTPPSIDILGDSVKVADAYLGARGNSSNENSTGTINIKADQFLEITNITSNYGIFYGSLYSSTVNVASPVIYLRDASITGSSFNLDGQVYNGKINVNLLSDESQVSINGNVYGGQININAFSGKAQLNLKGEYNNYLKINSEQNVDVSIQGDVYADLNIDTKGNISVQGQPGNTSIINTEGNVFLGEEFSGNSLFIRGENIHLLQGVRVGNGLDIVAKGDVSIQGNVFGNLNIDTKGDVELQGALGNTNSRINTEGSVTLEKRFEGNSLFITGKDINLMQDIDVDNNLDIAAKGDVSAKGKITASNILIDSKNLALMGDVKAERVSKDIQIRATENIELDKPIKLNFNNSYTDQAQPRSIVFKADSDENGTGSFMMNQEGSIETINGVGVKIYGNGIVVGSISTEQAGLPNGKYGDVVLESQKDINARDIKTNSGDIKLTAKSGITAGDLKNGGRDEAIDPEGAEFILKAEEGDISVESITTGAGGIFIDTPGTFRANGESVGSSSREELVVIKDSPEIIEFLVKQGIPEEQLRQSESLIKVTSQFKGNIVVYGSQGKITIRHGGESRPGKNISIETKAGTDGERQFVTGGPDGYKISDGYSIEDFDPSLEQQTFKLTKTHQSLSNEFPEDVSGTPVGIVIIDGKNNQLVDSLVRRPYDGSLPPPKPPEKPTPPPKPPEKPTPPPKPPEKPTPPPKLPEEPTPPPKLPEEPTLPPESKNSDPSQQELETNCLPIKEQFRKQFCPASEATDSPLKIEMNSNLPESNIERGSRGSSIQSEKLDFKASSFNLPLTEAVKSRNLLEWSSTKESRVPSGYVLPHAEQPTLRHNRLK